VYIVHSRDEAASEARLLQLELQKQLGDKCRVHAADAAEVEGGVGLRKALAVGVARADALVVLQTGGVLLEPPALLAMYVALRAGVAVVPVCIDAGGYNFEQAARAMSDLQAALPAVTLESLQGMLDGGVVPASGGQRSRRPSVVDMSRVLSKALPNLISTSFDPSGSEAHLVAVASDVASKVRRGAYAVAHSLDTPSHSHGAGPAAATAPMASGQCEASSERWGAPICPSARGAPLSPSAAALPSDDWAAASTPEGTAADEPSHTSLEAGCSSSNVRFNVSASGQRSMGISTAAYVACTATRQFRSLLNRSPKKPAQYHTIAVPREQPEPWREQQRKYRV